MLACFEAFVYFTNSKWLFKVIVGQFHFWKTNAVFFYLKLVLGYVCGIFLYNYIDQYIDNFCELNGDYWYSVNIAHIIIA